MRQKLEPNQVSLSASLVSALDVWSWESHPKSPSLGLYLYHEDININFDMLCYYECFIKDLANYYYIFWSNRQESNILYNFVFSLILAFIHRKNNGIRNRWLQSLLWLSYSHVFIEFNRVGTLKKITEVHLKTVPRFISCLINRLQFYTVLLQWCCYW